MNVCHERIVFRLVDVDQPCKIVVPEIEQAEQRQRGRNRFGQRRIDRPQGLHRSCAIDRCRLSQLTRQSSEIVHHQNRIVRIRQIRQGQRPNRIGEL